MNIDNREQKLFSIITVCKNSSSDIEKTILSVINQKYQNYEYIIIDGDSNDGTKEIIDKYRNHIDFFVSEKDSGIYQAMNKGILRSKGKYLLFLNGGDFLAGVDVLSDISRLENNEDIIIGRIITDGYHVSPEWNRRIDNYFLFCKAPPHQAAFIKKDMFTKVGMYDESLAVYADFDFFVKSIVKNKCQFKQLDLIVSYFRLGGVSSQKRYSKVKHKEAWLIRRENFSKLNCFFFGLRREIDICFNLDISKIFKKYIVLCSGLFNKFIQR